MEEKQALRARMRALRCDHVQALPPATHALVFSRPPASIAALAPEGSTVALYHANQHEAPTRGWAKWFLDNGRKIALPWFESRNAPMQFRLWSDPWEDTDLIAGAFGAPEPGPDAALAEPNLAIVPLLAFTARGERLGQGGGHYDRWLAANPDVTAIGIAWDCQLCDDLPLEAHDRRLAAIVTPTRIHEGHA